MTLSIKVVHLPKPGDTLTIDDASSRRAFEFIRKSGRPRRGHTGVRIARSRADTLSNLHKAINASGLDYLPSFPPFNYKE